MIQVRKRLESLWQFLKQSEFDDEYDISSRMSLQDVEEHHHKLPTTFIHNVEDFVLIIFPDCIFCHGKNHVIGNYPYRGNQFFGHPSFVPFSILMMPYQGLSNVFPIVPPLNFSFPSSLPRARLMPTRTPIGPNLCN
jgi:hypothetical protein